MKSLKGSGVALVTPFNADLSVDYDALDKLVRFQVQNGTDYLVVLGTTGESPAVSADEKKKIIETVKLANNGHLPLVLGMGGNNTLKLAEELKTADLSGFSAILSVCPYYNKPNQNGIRQHYELIAEASPLPVILYNVPGRTGVNMTAETTLFLAQHQNIIGMKEASGNLEQCMQIAKHAPADFLLISGDDALTLPLMAAGYHGVISVILNAFPKEFSKMVKLMLENRIEEARALHYLLYEAMTGIFADGSPGGIKVMLNELGICHNIVRPPLATVRSEVENRLRDLCRNIKS